MAAGVLAPQAADDVDGLLGGRGELQPRVHGSAGVEPEVLCAQAPAEAAGEDLGDERGSGPARLLAPQPPGHGCLVVSQVQSVFEPELVHATGETCVGEPRFCDERGELSIGSALRGSFRHLRCGLLPSGPQGAAGRRGTCLRLPRGLLVPGLPVSSPYGLVNGANVAERKHRIAHIDIHSSDRVRISCRADADRTDVQWRGRTTDLTKGSSARPARGPPRARGSF